MNYKCYVFRKLKYPCITSVFSFYYFVLKKIKKVALTTTKFSPGFGSTQCNLIAISWTYVLVLIKKADKIFFQFTTCLTHKAHIHSSCKVLPELFRFSAI